MPKPLKKPKARTKPKKRAMSLSTLKKRCDAAFSLYVRRSNADRNGDVSCVTCGSRMHYSKIQCGHFISRTYLSLRFDGINCNPQCVSCNIFRKGAIPEYAAYLAKIYGHGIVESLLETKIKPVKFTKADYLEMIERFSKEAT